MVRRNIAAIVLSHAELSLVGQMPTHNRRCRRRYGSDIKMRVAVPSIRSIAISSRLRLPPKVSASLPPGASGGSHGGGQLDWTICWASAHAVSVFPIRGGSGLRFFLPKSRALASDFWKQPQATREWPEYAARPRVAERATAAPAPAAAGRIRRVHLGRRSHGQAAVCVAARAGRWRAALQTWRPARRCHALSWPAGHLRAFDRRTICDRHVPAAARYYGMQLQAMVFRRFESGYQSAEGYIRRVQSPEDVSRVGA